MKQRISITRRRFGTLGLAAAGALWAPSVLGQNRPKVVIIGGGPGGIATARALATDYSAIDITLVEANAVYVTPFFSNRFIAGLWPLERISFAYDRLAAVSEIRLVHDRAVAVDADARHVRLGSGGVLNYDRLVMAAGADLIYDAIDGYGPEAITAMPHAYHGTDAEQPRLLRDQLRAMDDGGLVALSVPKRPYPCHPAPYERASLIAEWLQRHKPASKILLFDSNDTFPQMETMLDSWERDYGDLIEWLPGDFGGLVEAVDPAAGRIMTADDSYAPDVANIIPPQRASALAAQAGLTDDSGWCPIEPFGLESTRIAQIHVLGDACKPGDMPRSAYAAFNQGGICATAIGNALSGATRQAPEYSNACFFLLRRGRGLIIGGRYEARDGRITGIEGWASALDEVEATRAATAEAADLWYADLTGAMFD